MPEEDQIKILEDKLRVANEVIRVQHATMNILAIKLEQCRKAMQGFVTRVENGEIQSRRTYKSFCDILEETK